MHRYNFIFCSLLYKYRYIHVHTYILQDKILWKVKRTKQSKKYENFNLKCVYTVWF